MTDSHVGRREKTGPSLILPGHILAVPNVTPCAKTAAFHRTRHNTMTGESAPLLEPREGADAPSRRGRIVRVAAVGLLAAGAVVAVAGGSSRDAVALLRSPATKTTMPSVSHREARLGDGRWEEIEEAKRLMMAQERLQMQADAQTAAAEQSAFEDREASVARAGPGELASPDPTAPDESPLRSAGVNGGRYGNCQGMVGHTHGVVNVVKRIFTHIAPELDHDAQLVVARCFQKIGFAL